jgi:2-(1,2-epoxy-1,2-dihydrophenyl)acetyl-CoA isomerase
MTTRSDTVRIERETDIVRLVLNRPKAGNALNLEMAEALLEASILCQTDSTIRCVVLTGEGRLFCAGGDIDGFVGAGDSVSAYLSRLAGTLHMAISRLIRMQKPLVVLVNGPAAGAGVGLALLGDIVLAARSAHMVAAYGKLGLTPDGGLSWLLPRLIGLRRSQDFILTNRKIGMEEAEARGMITRAVEDEALASEGAEVIEQLLKGSPQAIAASRSLLHQSWLVGMETHMELEAQAIACAGDTAESRARVSAFLGLRDSKG